MWKGFVDRGKCLLGFHEGAWLYRRAGDCAQVLLCTRCGVETERVEHRWGAWDYQAHGACDLVRSCSRCAQSESRIEHAWGEATYAAPDACEQVAECTRCGAAQPREPLHVFNRWDYRDEDACSQVQACSRCGTAGTATRLTHDWSAWTDSPFYQSPVRICRHCGEMIVNVNGGSAQGPSMQAIEAAVERLAAAESSDDIRMQLDSNRAVLLSPVADKYLQFAFDQYGLDEASSSTLTGVQGLITRSRQVGIDRVLQDLAGPPAVAPAVPGPGTQRPSPTATEAPAGSGRLDRRLIGHWRHTEARGGGGFSIVIDTHCVLDEDGLAAWWSRTRSSMGDTDSEREHGRWEARANTLVVTFQGGETHSRDYIVDGDGMVWPGDGRYRYWERIR